MNNIQNAGTNVPININTNYGMSYPLANALQVELVNDELDLQNHRMQKKLVQQENYIRRYWQNENDKQIIVNNEWNKYNYLAQDERQFLFMNNIWRDKNKFYYQVNQDSEIISGSKEDIELEISSRNTFNIHFVDDLNNIKDIRFDTVYVSLKSLSVLTKNIYNPDYLYGLITYDSNVFQNDFVSTEYMKKRFTDYFINEACEPSPALHFIKNITTSENQMFLANIMGKYFKYLKSENTIVLIHNQDVSNLLWDSIITNIYGKHNVKVLDNEMLDTQLVDEILDKTLCIRIGFIPDNKERQN